MVAQKYFRQIKDNPTWKTEHIQQVVLQDLLADVHISKCKRVKTLVIEKLVAVTNGEYARLLIIILHSLLVSSTRAAFGDTRFQWQMEGAKLASESVKITTHYLAEPM
jgi:hypothetical protein